MLQHQLAVVLNRLHADHAEASRIYKLLGNETMAENHRQESYNSFAEVEDLDISAS